MTLLAAQLQVTDIQTQQRMEGMRDNRFNQLNTKTPQVILEVGVMGHSSDLPCINRPLNKDQGQPDGMVLRYENSMGKIESIA
mmetsp:Transcript_32540/g.49792  ORF Transcript_32540/g.49792 Transcript_32540/m.49792 type:complete len:83 (-) Transcript_32540:281-529(-)